MKIKWKATELFDQWLAEVSLWKGSVWWTKVQESNHREMRLDSFRLEAGCELSTSDRNQQLGQCTKDDTGFFFASYL